MKCNYPGLGFELMSPCPFPTYPNVSLCKIPVTMSKKSVFPSSERIIVFVFWLSIIIAVILGGEGGSYADNNCSIFPLCVESNANNNVAKRFLTCILLMIRQIIRSCDVMDRFLRKPFSFFRRFLSTSIEIYKPKQL